MKKDRWVPSDYPYDQQLWTDKDLAKFAAIAFVVGFILGSIL